MPLERHAHSPLLHKLVWHCVPLHRVVARQICSAPTPLFEEEGNPISRTEISDCKGPVPFHGPNIRTAFSAHDDPRDSVNIYISERTK